MNPLQVEHLFRDAQRSVRRPQAKSVLDVLDIDGGKSQTV